MCRIRVRTRRLELVAADRELIEADGAAPERFARILGARVPESWPPEHWDREAREHTRAILELNPEAVGWAGWYLLSPPDEEGERTCAGFCGVNRDLSPESIYLGYSVIDRFQGKGFATEATGALVGWAFRNSDRDVIVAETYPELVASIRVLQHNGFVLEGSGGEVGTLRFARQRRRERPAPASAFMPRAELATV